jgi:hypothetical protein
MRYKDGTDIKGRGLGGSVQISPYPSLNAGTIPAADRKREALAHKVVDIGRRHKAHQLYGKQFVLHNKSRFY